MERTRQPFNKFVLSSHCDCTVVSVRKTKKKNVGKQQTTIHFQVKTEKQNWQRNPIEYSHKPVQRCTKKAFLFTIVMSYMLLLSSTLELFRWKLNGRMNREKKCSECWVEWLIFDLFDTTFTLTCQRRSKISHEYMHYVTVCLCTTSSTKRNGSCKHHTEFQCLTFNSTTTRKIKMFSMAHHKCQVTVLLHDRVMVTTFKLKKEEKKKTCTPRRKGEKIVCRAAVFSKCVT